jgi:DNA-binding NarL/FixJ family response regulator
MAEKDARARILIVEDQMLIAVALEVEVQALGHAVCGIAASADEAIELADLYRPDLVLMDVRINGDRDGVDAATEIHARFAIRSLFLTAQIDEWTRERMSAANALGILPKPYSPEDLRVAIRAALAAVAGRN